MQEYIEIENTTKDVIVDNFYTVLSVELGNTTIKSFIITTNLKTNKSYLINKCVKLTRNIRSPLAGEEVFGKTIWQKPLSKEAIVDSIYDIICECLSGAQLEVDDLDFVVRSTGIVAVAELSDMMGVIIKALSDGCLKCGITPSQMKAPFKLDNIPQHIRRYSFFNTIEFDGSIVSVNPAYKALVSNQMESELVNAGIKLASKNSLVDFRNPVMSIDMGTTLAGCIVDSSTPYANTLCYFIGVAGAISDILLRGCEIINESDSAIDVDESVYSIENYDEIGQNTQKIHEYITVDEVPPDVSEYGGVKVDRSEYDDSSIKVIGSKIDDEKKLIETFNRCIKNYNNDEIMLQIDDINAYLIKRIVCKCKKLNLICQDMSVGITGRAAITGCKRQLTTDYISDIFDDIIFMQDGLALGALMMARCMNSLGSPINPIGGLKNGMCIMQQRVAYNKK